MSFVILRMLPEGKAGPPSTSTLVGATAYLMRSVYTLEEEGITILGRDSGEEPST